MPPLYTYFSFEFCSGDDRYQLVGHYLGSLLLIVFYQPSVPLAGSYAIFVFSVQPMKSLIRSVVSLDHVKCNV